MHEICPCLVSFVSFSKIDVGILENQYFEIVSQVMSIYSYQNNGSISKFVLRRNAMHDLN